MLGNRSGFVTLVKIVVIDIISVHCVVHRYALASKTLQKTSILSLYIVHAHNSVLDVICFNSQPSQCLCYVIIQIVGAGVSLLRH